MNIKKFLKKKAQADLRSLQTEHDKEILQSLKKAVITQAEARLQELEKKAAT